MKTLKKSLRKASLNRNLSSIKEVLQKYVEFAQESLEAWEGTVDDLVLVKAVEILRKEDTTIGDPQGIEESASLRDLIKSIEEVKENGKDILRRTRSPGK